MLAIAHVAVGAAVGVSVGIATGSPALAFAAGIVSHHLMDVIPHWDVGSLYPPDGKDRPLTARDLAIIGIDGLLTIVLGYILYRHFGNGEGWRSPLLWGAAGGLLPDFWHHVPFWKDSTRRWTASWYYIHGRLHHTARGSKVPLGVLSQVVAISLAWWWLSLIH